MLQEWNYLRSVCLQQLAVPLLRGGLRAPNVDAGGRPAVRVLRVPVPLPQHILRLCRNRPRGSRSPGHLDSAGWNSVSQSVYTPSEDLIFLAKTHKNTSCLKLYATLNLSSFITYIVMMSAGISTGQQF